MELGLAIHVAQEAAGLRPHEPGRRIHPDAAHRRHVEHHRAVRHRETGYVVAAPLDREAQTVLADELDRRDHVSHAETADHQPGAAIDHGVPDTACVVVPGVAGAEELPAQPRAQRGYRSGVDDVPNWSGVGSGRRKRGGLIGHGPTPGGAEGANIGRRTRVRQQVRASGEVPRPTGDFVTPSEAKGPRLAWSPSLRSG